MPADFLQRSVGLFRACVNNSMENSRREAAHVILTLPASSQVILIKCFPSEQSVTGGQEASVTTQKNKTSLWAPGEGSLGRWDFFWETTPPAASAVLLRGSRMWRL